MAKKNIKEMVTSLRSFKDNGKAILDIYVAFWSGEMDYITAHNKLIPLGVYLTEDEELLDY